MKGPDLIHGVLVKALGDCPEDPPEGGQPLCFEVYHRLDDAGFLTEKAHEYEA